MPDDPVPSVTLPPGTVAAVIDGREVWGLNEVEAAMSKLQPWERSGVVIVLDGGFRAPFGKFTTGDDEL